MKKLFYLFVFFALLFYAVASTAQTVNPTPFTKVRITGNVKQNNATRIVVQDSITKELNWVLKSSLSPWTKIGDNLQNNNSGKVSIGGASTVAKFTVVGAGNSDSTINTQFTNLNGTTLASIDDRGNFVVPNSIVLGRDLKATRAFIVDTNVGFINTIESPNQKYFVFKSTNNWLTDISIKYATDLSSIYDDRTLVDRGFVNTAISGSTSYLSKFTGTNILRSSSWRETSVGSRLFNGADDGFTTFQLTGSASISSTLKVNSAYSTAITGTATFGTGVQATSNGFADGLLAVSENGVAGDFDIQSNINGNESNIAEFKDNGVIKASISDVGLATVNGLVSNDRITTTSSIKIGDDTSPANQYTAGTFRYRSLGEVGFPEVVTQDSFGNYNWRTLYHSGNFNPSNYLPLTGGAMTGPLSGTTGAFSGVLSGTTGTFSTLQHSSAGFNFVGTALQLANTNRITWSSDGTATSAKDVSINRASAGVVVVSDGTSATATANLRDLRLRTLTATGLNVTAGTAPASATATGTAGAIIITSTFIYYCTATNTWVRSALTTW